MFKVTGIQTEITIEWADETWEVYHSEETIRVKIGKADWSPYSPRSYWEEVGLHIPERPDIEM